KAHCDERHGSVDEAHQYRSGRPDPAADEQCFARPKAVAEPSSDNLEEGIRIGESCKGEANLRVREMEIPLDHRRSRTNVRPIDIGDHIQQASDNEGQISGFETAE